MANAAGADGGGSVGGAEGGGGVGVGGVGGGPCGGAIGGLVGGIVPYQVAMDGGEAATTTTVLVHRDEHWLVRDLALQEVGPRIASDGTRVVKRMGKRKLGDDLWQVVDHVTRKVRTLEVSDDDDED